MDDLSHRVAASDGPLPAYRALVSNGQLTADPAQRMAAERLQALWRLLRGYDPPAWTEPARRGLFGRLLGRKPAEGADEARPHGLYLVGDVGRGKSMLMDLFFEAADLARKRRVHFHAFMQDAHRQLHAAAAARSEGEDPIPPLADRIARDAALLCFDEFQIVDIADAMILGRLFAALFERGVVVVATSNTAPARLFEGQPGRDAFLPFIALIERNLDVLVLEGGRDHRRGRMDGKDVWFVPADADADRALDAAFAELTDGAAARPARLSVMGRTLAIPRAAGAVARFGFAELCEQPLGPGDHLAIATHYHTLVLDRIPRLGPEARDTARRFVVLVDALYDHRVKLVASAAAFPDALYPVGDGADAFRRTASRLEEMRTTGWWELPHLT
jgi:cell division protein ZapE